MTIINCTDGTIAVRGSLFETLVTMVKPQYLQDDVPTSGVKKGDIGLTLTIVTNNIVQNSMVQSGCDRRVGGKRDVVSQADIALMLQL